ncbi:MAG: response regulator [Chitinophagales bacterium]|nr:response regulator [Chitinophagales bacterium]
MENINNHSSDVAVATNVENANNNYSDILATAAGVKYITYANMVDILEQERKRIAYDIHDSVQHSLRLIRDTAPADLKQDIDNVIDSLREVCYRLTPKSLDEFSLVDYFPIYIVTLQRSCKFYIDYRGNAASNLPSKVEAELFGIINEAMNNIIKYAAQTPIVFVRFWEDEEKFVLSIQDLGDGFDVSQTTNTIGLKSMRGRAEMLNATFDLQSTIGEGTKIKVFLPKANVPNVDTTPKPNPTEQTKNTAPQSISGDTSNQKQISDNLIYIVDNQEEIGLGLKQIVEEEFPNYQIILFTKPDDATAALRVLEARKEPQPAIIISDITMPNKSGFVFVKEAQTISPNSKYIIYTVNDLPVYIVKAVKELKVNAFVCKEEQEGNGARSMITAISQIRQLQPLNTELNGTRLVYCSPKAEQVVNKIGDLSKKFSWEEESMRKYVFLLIIELIKDKQENKQLKLTENDNEIMQELKEDHAQQMEDYRKQKTNSTHNVNNHNKPKLPDPVPSKITFKVRLMHRLRNIIYKKDASCSIRCQGLRNKILELQKSSKNTVQKGEFNASNINEYMKIHNEIYSENLWEDGYEAKWQLLSKIATDIFS